MLENDENFHQIDVSMPKRISVLFVKTLAILSFYKKVSSKCPRHSFSRLPLANEVRNDDPLIVEELCFIQDFDALSEEKLKATKTDKILEYIRLSWHPTACEPRKFPARKKCGLVPIGAIRETVSLVPRNKKLRVMDQAEPHVVKHCNMS